LYDGLLQFLALPLQILPYDGSQDDGQGDRPGRLKGPCEVTPLLPAYQDGPFPLFLPDAHNLCPAFRACPVKRFVPHHEAAFGIAVAGIKDPAFPGSPLNQCAGTAIIRAGDICFCAVSAVRIQGTRVFAFRVSRAGYERAELSVFYHHLPAAKITDSLCLRGGSLLHHDPPLFIPCEIGCAAALGVTCTGKKDTVFSGFYSHGAPAFRTADIGGDLSLHIPFGPVQFFFKGIVEPF